MLIGVLAPQRPGGIYDWKAYKGTDVHFRMKGKGGHVCPHWCPLSEEEPEQFTVFTRKLTILLGLTRQLRNKEPTCRRLGFHPWVGKVPWRSKWQPTPVFLPGKFQGQRSLADYSPWGHRESDTTERPNNKSVGLLPFLVLLSS